MDNNHIVFRYNFPVTVSGVYLDEANVNAFNTWLLSFTGDISSIFFNKEDFIINLKFYPFSIDNYIGILSTEDYLNVFSFETPVKARTLIVNNYKKVASYTLERYFNTFADYSPYTKISIYLPLVGWCELDVNKCYGTINVYLSVDFVTGMGTYFVEVEKGDEKMIILTQSVLMGYDIPITASNANEVFTKATLSAVSLGVGIMGSGGTTASKIQGATAGSIDMISNVHTSVNTRGSGNDISMGAGGLTCKLLITRPILSISKNEDGNYDYSEYALLNGMPSNKTIELNELNGGYVSVANIHLQDFDTATKEELNEIEQLLKSGVLL